MLDLEDHFRSVENHGLNCYIRWLGENLWGKIMSSGMFIIIFLIFLQETCF